MCVGANCIDIFRLEQYKILEDTSGQYPGAQGYFSGKYLPLGPQVFLGAKNLTSYFPTDLLKEPNTIIGSPDAREWGGL